jgi:two-component system, NarL family, nitrate/nitrite response regulator NarL
MPIRLVVAHHMPIVRHGLQLLLESRGTVSVVGEACDGIQAVDVARQAQPDILLIDLAMPAGGIDLLRLLATAAESVRPIVLAEAGDSTLGVALRAGARGIVLKQSTVAMLFKSLETVMRGEYWLIDDRAATEIEALRRMSVERNGHNGKNRFRLTRREMQIVAAVADGDSNKAIGERLSVTEDTVKHHLSNIFDKVGVFSRLELAMFAIHHGLLPEGEAAPGQ